jgi:regulator of protease activity HflC (stomatin/prohibitin superfamily)
MRKLFDTALGIQRITVLPTQRVLVLEKGRFRDVLGPGEHRLPHRDVALEWHDLNRPVFESAYADALLRDRPDLADRLVWEVRTGPTAVAVVLRDDRPFQAVQPGTRGLYLADAGPWAVERFDVSGDLAVGPDAARRFSRGAALKWFAEHVVPEAHAGLLTVDGTPVRVLEPGTHRFWNAGRAVTVRVVDLRWRSHDVAGQEILTRDRVPLRVNLAADFRVVDPQRAVSAVRDFEEALHRALQFAFRRTLGALTLDQLLADKVSVDAEAAAKVRGEMAGIGLELGEIAIKDVILPGEMRAILTRVVEAQKEAEANVIRRREETNATRSLLNTAKVMEENPVMLRLKELEALETVAGKIGHLTVHNGTAGLLTDLVRLRD